MFLHATLSWNYKMRFQKKSINMQIQSSEAVDKENIKRKSTPGAFPLYTTMYPVFPYEFA